MRKPLDYIVLLMKGMSMGAADVVPGVSGGTIALITGIYEELISSLKSFNIESLKLLFRKGLGSFWSNINGSFLLAVFSGVLISIFSLARILKWLLLENPNREPDDAEESELTTICDQLRNRLVEMLSESDLSRAP